MIKYKISHQNRIRVKTRGTLNDLATESLLLVGIVYRNLLDMSPKAADEYKQNMIASMIDPNSPVFKIPVE